MKNYKTAFFLRQTAHLPVEVLSAGGGGTQAFIPRSFQQQSFSAGPFGEGVPGSLLLRSFQQSFPVRPSGGSPMTYPMMPWPSFLGPSSSSPSQLVLWGGYLGPPSQVLPAVLPSWSLPSGPSGGPTCLSYDAWALFMGASSSPSHLVLLGVPCDLSHNALDVTCLLSRHKLMDVA